MNRIKKMNSKIINTFAYYRTRVVLIFIFLCCGAAFYYFSLKKQPFALMEFLESEVVEFNEASLNSIQKTEFYKKQTKAFQKKDYFILKDIVLNQAHSESKRVFSVYLLGFAYDEQAVPHLKEISIAPFIYNFEFEDQNDVEVLIRSLALEGLSQLAREGGVSEALTALKEIEDQLEVPELFSVYEYALAYARGESDTPVFIQEKKELENFLKNQMSEAQK